MRPRALALAGLALCLAACAPITPYHQGRLREVPPSQGQEIELKEGRELKVLIARDQGALKLSTPGGLLLLELPSGRELYRLEGGGKSRLTVRSGRFMAGGRDLGPSLALKPLAQDGAVLVSGRRYRGSLSLEISEQKKPLLINTVGLEEYLLGVLPGEVPPSWPQDALMAQAVAARTYALFRAQKPSPQYDLDDTTSSQVYLGTSKEDPRSSLAVRRTSGKVLTHQGRLVEAFFHSNCGGRTADVSKVWSGQQAYLKGVACGYCRQGKHYRWEAAIEASVAGRKAKALGLCPGGDLEGIKSLEEDGSGRLYRIQVRCESGAGEVKASALRQALGADLLRSTRFQVHREGRVLRFEGRGWGHGIGLCQEGAQGMAEDGYGYERILLHYFPGCRLAALGD